MVYIYEIKVEDRQTCSFENVLLEHENYYDYKTFEGMIENAKCEIEEFREETYDEYNTKMVDILDTYDDFSSIQGVSDYLCEYNGFERHIPKERVSVYLN